MQDNNGMIIYPNGDHHWHQNGGNTSRLRFACDNLCEWFRNGKSVDDARVREQLWAQIVRGNARKIVFVYAMGVKFTLPQDIEMVICSYM